MRRISRRDLLRASAAVVAARTMAATGLAQVQQAAQGSSKPPVIWLSGQACSGCSVSLLNSIHYQTIDDLLINTIDLKYTRRSWRERVTGLSPPLTRPSARAAMFWSSRERYRWRPRVITVTSGLE